MDLSSLKFFIVGSVKIFYFSKSDVSAVQGHPRSLILAPIESAHASSYWSVIVTLVLSCAVSKILQVFCVPDPTPYSTLILGVFPLLLPDRPCWGQHGAVVGPAQSLWPWTVAWNRGNATWWWWWWCLWRLWPWFCVMAVKISALCVISAVEWSLEWSLKAMLWQRNRTMPL